MKAMATWRNDRTGAIVESDSETFARSGRWTRVDAAPTEGAGAASLGLPDDTARKSEWETYARSVGLLSGSAADVTKAELIRRCREGDSDGSV